MSFVFKEQKYTKLNPERKDRAIAVITDMVIYWTLRNRNPSTIISNWDHDKNIEVDAD